MKNLKSRLALPSLLAGTLTLLAVPGSAGAHHSFAMFDNQKDVVIDGVVKEFQWTNPHTWIQIMVTEGGRQVEYSIEGASPNGLARRGWSRNSLKAGDKVKLTIHPLKDGSKGGSFVRAILPDGSTLSNT